MSMRALAPPLSVIAGLMTPARRAERHLALAAAHPVAHPLAGRDEDIRDEAGLADIPPLVANLIAARLAVAGRRLSTTPQPGLILQFGAGCPAPDQADADPIPPCAVIVTDPTGDPRIWHGYLMAAETDYATDWDLLLQEEDEPVDPTARMIQAWNRVRVSCPAATMALGLLPPQRLATLRDLVAAIGRREHARVEPQPGELVQRACGSTGLILTGTPLLDVGLEDPRCAYQAIYREVAERLTAQAARIRMPLAPVPWWQRALAALRDAADQWQVTLTPVPVLAMGPGTSGVSETDTTVATWRLGETLDLQLIPGPDGQSVQIHATLAPGQAPVTLALVEADGLVTQQRRLDAQQPDGDLWAEAGLTLSVRDEAGGRLFEARLPDPLAGQS